ncbi:phosphoheptose isomerase [Microbacteriaceae bacterium]|nr:phosphoheptose isomerase [Candidatus Saccharibacteria bacterium]
MAEFAEQLDTLKNTLEQDKKTLLADIIKLATEAGYTVADVDDERPWGGFVRFDYKDGDTFVNEFFPEVDPVEARLGNPDAELSPKILLVEPGQRLSWQLHHRRAERWAFLTDGAYYKSSDPEEMGELVEAKAGDVVQFEAGECHRLVGAEAGVTLVAEIWQHTEKDKPSDEDDIVRLQDDYKR